MIMDVTEDDSSRAQGPREGAQHSAGRSGMLLTWLKDPSNQFMFWKEGSHESVMDRLEQKSKDIGRSECSSPTSISEFETSNDTTTRGSLDSDIWDVSSLDTPTMQRKAVPRDRPRRKTTSFKGSKHICSKIRRRHTCGTTSRESLAEQTGLTSDGNCYCQRNVKTLSPSLLDLFSRQKTKRNSFNDSDSGIIDFELGKDQLMAINDSNLFEVQVPLDEIERKNTSMTRSKSEGNIHSSSILTGIYKDIDTQCELPAADSNVSKAGKFPFSRKCQSLKEPLRKTPAVADQENHLTLFRTKSLFDLSGKDPESEADFFFGVKSEESKSRFQPRQPLNKGISKSCNELPLKESTESHLASGCSRRLVVVSKQETYPEVGHHQKAASLPSLRVRALRNRLTKEDSTRGARLTRLRLGSLDRKHETGPLLRKNSSLSELREKLRSIDITDLVNKSDIYQKDDNGNTLLHYAAAQGDDELIRTILSEGASVWTPNKFGHLPLDFSGSFRSATFLSHSTLFYGHGSNMARQGHLHRKSIHYEL